MACLRRMNFEPHSFTITFFLPWYLSIRKYLGKSRHIVRGFFFFSDGVIYFIAIIDEGNIYTISIYQFVAHYVRYTLEF